MQSYNETFTLETLGCNMNTKGLYPYLNEHNKAQLKTRMQTAEDVVLFIQLDDIYHRAELLHALFFKQFRYDIEFAKKIIPDTNALISILSAVPAYEILNKREFTCRLEKSLGKKFLSDSQFLHINALENTNTAIFPETITQFRSKARGNFGNLPIPWHPENTMPLFRKTPVVQEIELCEPRQTPTNINTGTKRPALSDNNSIFAKRQKTSSEKTEPGLSLSGSENCTIPSQMQNSQEEQVQLQAMELDGVFIDSEFSALLKACMRSNAIFFKEPLTCETETDKYLYEDIIWETEEEWERIFGLV